MLGHSGNSRESRYAWVVLVVSFLTIALTQGTRSAYGVFMEPLTMEFGWNRATVAMPPAIAMIAFAVTQPMVGRAIDIAGSRCIIAVGVLLLGFSSLMLVWATRAWQFALLAGVLTGIGAGGSGSLPNSVLISGWFPRRRGFALGIVSSGISVGQAILAPLLALVIIAFGWRCGFGVTAVLLIVVNLPLAWFLLRDPKSPSVRSPSSFPARRPSSHPIDEPFPSESSAVESEKRDVSLRRGETRGTLWWDGLLVPSFWWLNLSYFVCGFTDFFIYNHLVIYARDLGYFEMTAASAMSVVAVAGIVGTLVIGAWSDRASPKNLMGWSYVSRAVGFVLLGFAVGTPISLFVFSFVTGASFLATIPLSAVITRRLFGQHLMGTFYGIVSLAHQVGAAAGIFLGGLVFDASGSYEVLFALGATLLVAAAIMSFLIREEPPFRYKEWPTVRKVRARRVTCSGEFPAPR